MAPEQYAVHDWLAFGINSRDPATVETCTYLCRSHLIHALGRRRLRDLTAKDVDRWLAAEAVTLSTRTLQPLHSCLNRAVK